MSADSWAESAVLPKVPALPEFKTTKSGYEIRTEILSMAKDLAISEYQIKFAGWEIQQTRDEKTGQVVSTVGMPEFPGLESILSHAQKMYDFVQNSTGRPTR